MPRFVTELCAAVLSAEPGGHDDRRLFGRAIADTLAVAAAGFDTPTVRRTQRAVTLTDGPVRTWSGTRVASIEDAALVNGAAAHALDFDDLDTGSSAHLSAVVLATLCSDDRWPEETTLLASMRAALIVAHAVGRRLGREHYAKGWHATATIGVLAATAAYARAVRMSPDRLGHALALAAAQAAGLRANFGSMGKALQAGFAAAAARRSIRLATHGITGGDIFAEGGFLSLYGRDDRTAADIFTGDPRTITPKLFPCCFAAHRMVAAALRARAVATDGVAAPDIRITVAAPPSSLAILHVDQPQNAVEAAFSARYCVAAAFYDGALTLERFDDPLDPVLQSLMDRIAIVESEDDDSGFDMSVGSATLVLVTARGSSTFRQSELPGAGDDTLTRELLKSKIANCLRRAPAAQVAPVLTRQVLGLDTVAPWFPPEDQWAR